MEVTCNLDFIKHYYGDQVAYRCSNTPIGETCAHYLSDLRKEFFARRIDEDKYDVRVMDKESGIAGMGF